MSAIFYTKKCQYDVDVDAKESYVAIEVTLRCGGCMIFSKNVIYLRNQNCNNISDPGSIVQ